MVDVDTFLTTLYVMVDDFCHSYPPKTNPGPEASLSESEVVSLAIFARWNRFTSERDFYRYAEAHALIDPGYASNSLHTQKTDSANFAGEMFSDVQVTPKHE